MNKEVQRLVSEYVQKTCRMIINDEFESRNEYKEGNYTITVGSFLKGDIAELHASDNIFITISNNLPYIDFEEDISIDIWANKIEIDNIEHYTTITLDDSYYELTEEMYMQLMFVYDLSGISYPTLRELFFLCGVVRDQIQ